MTFTVTSGPHAGVTGVTTLDAFGTARFSYQGARGGVDLVSATLECTGSPCPAAATASVTWSEPDATPVVSLKSRGVASVSVSRFKRCVRGRFAIRPRYGDAAIQSSTLFVDGRRIKTNTGLGRFVLGARRFKAGKHHFEIVTIFEGGAAASKFGSFSRCKSR